MTQMTLNLDTRKVDKILPGLKCKISRISGSEKEIERSAMIRTNSVIPAIFAALTTFAAAELSPNFRQCVVSCDTGG